MVVATEVHEELLRAIRPTAEAPVPGFVAVLVEAIRRRHGAAVAAVLFYGSCRRRGVAEGVVDLYVLVDGYRAAYGRWLPALANRILPPNVFWLEAPGDGGTLRAKYAVYTVRQFGRAASTAAFTPYVQGRFAQPCTIAWTRDEAAAGAALDALAIAPATLLRRALPLAGTDFSLRGLWLGALADSYATELRAERAGQGARLLEAEPDYYDRVGAAALGDPALPVRPGAAGDGGGYSARYPAGARAVARALRPLRRVAGKTLSVLRLGKAIFTFEGGPEYILWKIERHSGVRLPVTDWQRRHPLLAAPGMIWRLWRRGAFR